MSYVTYPNNPFPPSSENSGGGGGQYVLPVASDETLGGVKVGSNLTIDESGALSAPTPYSLPVASDETLGGVKVGAGLSINNGVLSASSRYSETVIYTGDGTSQSTYELTQPITSFDLIGVRFLRTNNIELFNIFPSSYLNSLISSGHITGVATNDKWCFFGVTDTTHIYRGDESDLHIVEIIGINV